MGDRIERMVQDPITRESKPTFGMVITAPGEGLSTLMVRCRMDDGSTLLCGASSVRVLNLLERIAWEAARDDEPEETPDES